MEGPAFCPYCTRHTGYMGIHAFTACNGFAIHGLTDCLIYSSGMPHNMAADQETHCIANEVQTWAHVHGVY